MNRTLSVLGGLGIVTPFVVLFARAAIVSAAEPVAEPAPIELGVDASVPDARPPALELTPARVGVAVALAN